MPTERSVHLCGRSLGRPGHICAFFDSRVEEYDVLTPYFKEGIEQGEQVINIVDADRVSDHRRQLERRGIPVGQAVEADQLRVLTSEETYTSGGRFSAERMYELLQSALADARQKNQRVRTSGVMDWASHGHAGTEELMTYESRVNVLVPTYDCTLLCVYDLDKLTGANVMDILATHPYVVHRRQILQNPYYIPPIELLKTVLLDSAKVAEAQ